jgi:hypothetical protein
MRVAVVALILAVGVIILLAFNDVVNPWGLGGLVIGAPVILLFCIPLSLAFFTFLSHREEEQRKAERKEKQE